MFSLGIIIASLSYVLFFLGVAGFFYQSVILVIIFFWTAVLMLLSYFRLKSNINTATLMSLLQSPVLYLLLLQASINLLGALGPELAFDSLWYHLTIPKIYLQTHSVIYVPGNLLYYSAMPKLIEIIFAAGLALGSEIPAKLMHFGFGILSLFVIYKVARIKFSPKTSIIACLIFYSNLLVGWESITAFVDLGRVFFELLALFSVINFYKTKKIKWVAMTGLMIGFATAVKLLAVSSLFILAILINIVAIKYVKSIKKIIYINVIYAGIFLTTVAPWLLFSYLNTGNPFFPLFSNLLLTPSISFDLRHFLTYIWNLFVVSNDPISPIYLITLPLIPFILKKTKNEAKIIAFYSIGGILLAYFIPYTDVARYTLSYLAGLSVFALFILDNYKNSQISKVIFGVVIACSLFSIFYRAAANIKFVPVILGAESKNEFLIKNLNFSFGDFYDTNGNIKNIVGENNVLIYGVHNLYYVDFNYIHESWVQKGQTVKYILVQNGEIPKKFTDWEIVYENNITHVKLYTTKNTVWVY